jgi:hypothetical protein
MENKGDYMEKKLIENIKKETEQIRVSWIGQKEDESDDIIVYGNLQGKLSKSDWLDDEK